MTSALTRRGFLGRTAATGLGIALAGSVDAIGGTSARAAVRPTSGYGALVADPAGLLALPPGFSYQVVAEAGVTLLETGQPTPSDADGTGAFASGRGTTLVNNHEIGGTEPFGVPPLPGLTFDPGARGGTTSIDVDKQGARVREYVSVAGTHNNCAGGITPWGTWLTCEETEARKGGLLQQDHGWVFEVSPVQSENPGSSPVPLRFFGRYAHEAVAVDPTTDVVYLTEDAGSPLGLWFRWVPPTGFQGAKGAYRTLAQAPGGDTAGTLQAMRATKGGVPVKDLSQATTVGTTYAVAWVDVPDRLATTTSVRKQLEDSEVTRSRKLEGTWYSEGGVYVVASFARAADGSTNDHDGQVWFFDPARQTITLRTLFGVNPDPDVDAGNYDGPDNMTVSPYGGLVLAEDGEGVSHLVGITAGGETYPMARNDLNDSEFTGPVFSADSSLLFANIQSPGHVYAIRGPWASQRA